MVGDSPPYKQLQPQFQDYVPQQQITHSDNLQTEDQTARAIQPPLLNPDPASKMYVTLAKNAQQLDM